MDDHRKGTIYIIPLRIEDVPLPREIARLQYVNHFEDQWRRKLALGLARAVSERGKAVPAPLEVAAAQSDEGGIVPRAISEAPPQGSLDATWFTYAIDGEYWDFVNGVIRSRALGGLYEARRHLVEWWQQTGSSWELQISEFHRREQLVSLTVATSSYFAGAAHPNHGVYTINILGEAAGIVTAHDLFDASSDGLIFLIDYVNLDLRRQYADGSDAPDISSYAEHYGWDLFEQFNFNEAGMQLNLSSASGLPHVFGFLEVYVPWQHAGQFLAPVAKRILLGAS